MTLPYYVEPEYWVEGYAEGDAKIVDASISAALTVAANIQRVKPIDASTAAATTTAASVDRVRLAAMLDGGEANAVAAVIRKRLTAVNATAALEASGQFITINNTQAAIASLLSAVASVQRRRGASVAGSVYAIISASARYKWLDEAVTAETWTGAGSASDTWTPAAASSDIWTQRAAALDTWTPAASDATNWTET